MRERLRAEGGPERVDAVHAAGKLTARERVGLLFDQDEPTFELGLLLATSGDDGDRTGSGVVTSLGRVAGREVVVVAFEGEGADGGWRVDTVQKLLRAQEAAMRCRIPIVYLVDSGGSGVPIRGHVFPGQYGAGRALYYAAVMRRHLDVPQFAAVLGRCVGSAAYLSALADVIVMVEGTSFLALGDPELVRAATGRDISAEELGGAGVHTSVSGVAHYTAQDDPECIELLRRAIAELPGSGVAAASRVPTPPVRLSYELYDLLPDDPHQPYDGRAALECILDGDAMEEFQPEHAPEIICGTAYVEGVRVAFVANAQGLLRVPDGATRFGGLLYAESARKARYFVESVAHLGLPLLFVQDVSGFMIGPESEHVGVLRAGAELLEAIATVGVPKLVVTLNRAAGAGYYAMAGQGFDPDFTIALPTALIGVGNDPSTPESHRPEGPLDALAAAREGFTDEVLLPEELRPALGLLLHAVSRNPGPHIGAFQLGRA